MKRKLLFLLTEDKFFCSHFIARALAAQAAGYEVCVAAREQQHGSVIRNAGLRLIPLNFQRRSTNPLKELVLLFQIWRLYLQERPHIVHHIAAKPILYGSFAACLSGVHAIVNAPVGMGYVFSSNDTFARVLRPLVRLAYRFLTNPRRSKVIFENPEDLDNFVHWKAVRRADAVLIRGAGIDLQQFHPTPAPAGTPVVVLIARLLRDKGVVEFVEAAQQLHQQGVAVRMVLVGDPDPLNPSSLTTEQLQAWDGQHGVEWWGWREDIAAVLKQSHIACLPSYREGLPKTLLEAAACGLPIVTTDTTGCREVVDPGQNGLLVPVRDASALAQALRQLIEDPDLRQRMGAHSRLKAEREFASERIIEETLAVYTSLMLAT